MKYSNKSNRCHRERSTSRGGRGSFIACKSSQQGRRARGRRAYRVPVGYVEVKTARVDYTGEEDDGLLIGYSQSGEELWRIHEASTLNPDDDSGEWLLEDVTTGHPIKWFSNSTSAEEHAKGLIYEIEE